MNKDIQFGKIYVRTVDGLHFVPIKETKAGTIEIIDMRCYAKCWVQKQGFTLGHFRLVE